MPTQYCKRVAVNKAQTTCFSEVVDRIGIRDSLKVTRRVPRKAELVDCRRCVGQQALFEGGICPSPRHYFRTPLRTNLIAIHLDPSVHRFRIDQAFFARQRLSEP